MQDQVEKTGDVGLKSRAELLDALVRKAYDKVSRSLDSTSDSGSKAIDDLIKLVKVEKDMPAERAEDLEHEWMSNEGEAEND